MSPLLSVDAMGRMRAKIDFIRWTQPEIERVLALRKEGFTKASIAAIVTDEFGMRRTANGVTGMLKSLVARKVEIAPANRVAAAVAAAQRQKMERAANLSTRLCLCCRANFHSEGPGNRICQPCKSSETWR